MRQKDTGSHLSHPIPSSKDNDAAMSMEPANLPFCPELGYDGRENETKTRAHTPPAWVCPGALDRLTAAASSMLAASKHTQSSSCHNMQGTKPTATTRDQEYFYLWKEDRLKDRGVAVNVRRAKRGSGHRDSETIGLCRVF